MNKDYVNSRLRSLGINVSIGLIPKAPKSKYPPGTTHKTCTLCGACKPLADFSESKHGALGRQARCKACICKIGKEYTRTNREAKAGRERPDRCDCCQQLHTARRAMHWDHDHATNQFRGWICSSCNAALGHVDDSIERLSQLIGYLRRGGGPLG
jgi:hypothetical protein